MSTFFSRYSRISLYTSGPCFRYLHNYINPSRCGGWGNPEERLTEDLNRTQDSFQTMNVNWRTRSETMSVGSPWSQNTCCSTNLAVSLGDASFRGGMKCVILLNRSTTVRMVVWPLEGGRQMIKSKETSQGKFHNQMFSAARCSWPPVSLREWAGDAV